MGKLRKSNSLKDSYIGHEINILNDYQSGNNRYFYAGTNPADILDGDYLNKPIILSRRKESIMEIRLDNFLFDEGGLRKIDFFSKCLSPSDENYLLYNYILDLSEKGLLNRLNGKNNSLD